jgi:hypothetical protein
LVSLIVKIPSKKTSSMCQDYWTNKYYTLFLYNTNTHTRGTRRNGINRTSRRKRERRCRFMNNGKGKKK